MDSISPTSQPFRPLPKPRSVPLSQRLHWLSLQSLPSLSSSWRLSLTSPSASAKIIPCEEESVASPATLIASASTSIPARSPFMSPVSEADEMFSDLPLSDSAAARDPKDGDPHTVTVSTATAIKKGASEPVSRKGRASKGRKFEVSESSGGQGTVREGTARGRGGGQGGASGKKSKIIQSTSAFATVSTPETKKEQKRREKKEREVLEKEAKEKTRREDEQRAQNQAQSWPMRLRHSVTELSRQVFESNSFASQFRMRDESSDQPNEVSHSCPLLSLL
jgi:hypothetical protein